jgi:hypothetical protein
LQPRTLARVLLAWALVTALACAIVHHAFALDLDEERPRPTVGTVWSEGRRIAGAVLPPGTRRDSELDAALQSHPGATLAYETIVAEGPVLTWGDLAFSLSFVPGRDGIGADIGGGPVYVTPDELLNVQAYDKGINLSTIQLSVGLDVPLALALLSERLRTTVSVLLQHGRFRRIRVTRSAAGESPPIITADGVTEDNVRGAVLAAAHYLSRGVGGDGRFRYLVDAPTNRTLPGYDWPRHAGATYFVAQVAALSGDPEVAYAALRAASYLRDHAMLPCGAHRCIGDGARVDVGSTALAVIAFVEVARSGLDRAYALVVPELAAFLRAQQRPDGEFMHEFDRDANQPVDVQLLYYSGEAALALSRAHSLLGDGRDLEAATHALAYLVGPAWQFLGSRYYWGEEHWTCQAMDDLWDHAPVPIRQKALDFCLRWQAFGRKLQFDAGDSPMDADGAYGFGPLITPRLTPAGSRTEAALATLDAAARAGIAPAELRTLQRQIRRTLALLMRHQLGHGQKYLFADPGAVEGAVPGSEVDWQLRIDYAQHTGSAMVRFLEFCERDGPGAGPRLQ